MEAALERDNEFWSIILTSFDIAEIDDLAEYAKDVEDDTRCPSA